MKKKFLFFVVIIMLTACGSSSRVHPAIGAEKIFMYTQPGFKPKNKKEKEEYKIVMKQIKEDAKRAKKPPKSSSSY